MLVYNKLKKHVTHATFQLIHISISNDLSTLSKLHFKTNTTWYMRHVSTSLVYIVLQYWRGTTQVQATVTDTSSYSKEYLLESDGQGTFFRNKWVLSTGTELQVIFSTPLMMHPSHKHSASSYVEGYISGFSTILKIQQTQRHEFCSRSQNLVKFNRYYINTAVLFHNFILFFEHYKIGLITTPPTFNSFDSERFSPSFIFVIGIKQIYK